MTLSWRQIVAYLEFNAKLDRIDHVNDLIVTAIGAQGDSKGIESTLKAWGGK